jgi:hypothetical protein
MGHPIPDPIDRGSQTGTVCLGFLLPIASGLFSKSIHLQHFFTWRRTINYTVCSPYESSKKAGPQAKPRRDRMWSLHLTKATL